jgi:uncharacterized phage protein (TIGR01671 family)
MEDLEFRIYDPEKEQMLYSGGTPMMVSNFFEYTAPLNSFGKIPYSRNLGLQDKKQKQIFSGDIIKWPSRRLGNEKGFDIGFLAYDPRGMEYWLYFDLDKRSYTGIVNLYQGAQFVGEVIGNIFQNPELLITK